MIPDRTNPAGRSGKTGPDPVANAIMETTNSTLANRLALVTGGGRGIGQAISLGLAERGARVAVLARSADQVRETAARITGGGGQALALPGDIGNPDQVAAALDTIGQRWGSIELLVNNAAVVWPLGPSATIDASQWATAIAINVTAAARLTFTVLPGMLAQGWGRIVNVSSGIASSPAAMLRANAYATSKAALEAHTLNLAAELAGTGVTVNVYRPGGVDTAMQGWIRKQDPEQVGATLHQRFTDNYQRGTLLTPAQSAASLLTRLPSPASGQIWDVSDPQ
jgi:NAD(P)-dependent dehydrogenase (short-subunit alcohol dehydrogenase family)